MGYFEQDETMKATSHYGDRTGNTNANTKCWRVAGTVPLQRQYRPTNSWWLTNVCQCSALVGWAPQSHSIYATSGNFSLILPTSLLLFLRPSKLAFRTYPEKDFSHLPFHPRPGSFLFLPRVFPCSRCKRIATVLVVTLYDPIKSGRNCSRSQYSISKDEQPSLLQSPKYN